MFPLRSTLADFARQWWELHAVVNLAPSTQKTYPIMWDKHVLPRIGGLELRELDPMRCQAFAAGLATSGVGPAARRKTLLLLGAVLQKAVEWNRLQANPMRTVKLPPAKRDRVVRPLAPARVEAVRGYLLAAGRHHDACLVSVLAYAVRGPSEALALRWRDVGERTLTIYAPKTNRTRSARLMAPVRADLLEWRLLAGRPADEALVFQRSDGEQWTPDDWRNWRSRAFTPALAAAGVEHPVVPYDLRHSAASLWLHEGCSVIEVAAWLGHAPTMTLTTYGHVMAELVGAD